MTGKYLTHAGVFLAGAALLLVLIYSSRYLEFSVALFSTVVLVRITFALVTSVFVTVLAWGVIRLRCKEKAGRLALAIGMISFSVVATLMVLASNDQGLPNVLINSYLLSDAG